MVIFPEVYIRESDGTRESYSSISDLETKLAATWSQVLKPLRSWMIEISPEIFEPYSDGTDEVVSEFVKSLFPTIDISNTQLSALQALCGGEVDILLYDPNETSIIPCLWDVSIFLTIIEEGTEFSKIQISAERKTAFGLNFFSSATGEFVFTGKVKGNANDDGDGEVEAVLEGQKVWINDVYLGLTDSNGQFTFTATFHKFTVKVGGLGVDEAEYTIDENPEDYPQEQDIMINRCYLTDESGNLATDESGNKILV